MTWILFGIGIIVFLAIAGIGLAILSLAWIQVDERP